MLKLGKVLRTDATAWPEGRLAGGFRLNCRHATEEPYMPKIDSAAAPARKGSGYPPPFDAPCAARTRQRLGEAVGAVNLGHARLLRCVPAI